MPTSPLRSLLVLALLSGAACSKPQEPTPAKPDPAAPAATPAASPAALPPLDPQLIGERLGTTAQPLDGGAVAATLLREGLAVSIEGAPLAGALRTELLFRPAPSGAALSGSVELLEDEVSPVIDTLLAHGVRAVGLSSRYLYDQPRVLVLSFAGEGNVALLASGAQSISAVLRDARLRSAKPLSALPGDAPERGKLDATALGGVLGARATAQGDTVLLELPRPPSTGSPTTNAARSLLRASFSGSDLRAVVDGSLLLQEKELNPALSALRAANVHPVGIVPRGAESNGEWYTLHFRGKGSSLTLVRALAQAVGAALPPSQPQPQP